MNSSKDWIYPLNSAACNEIPYSRAKAAGHWFERGAVAGYFRHLITPLVPVICGLIILLVATDIRAQSNGPGEETPQKADPSGWLEEEEEEAGDEFEEFGEVPDDLEDQMPSEPKRFSLSGFLEQELAYSYLRPDTNFPFNRKEAQVSRIRSTLNLVLDARLSEKWKAKISGNAFYDAYYRLEGRENFPEETLDAYESELEFRDTYIDGPLADSWWLRFGRQIMAWGESDVFQITDMANPRDNRELGTVNVEDIRLPVVATQLTYAKKGWELNAVAIHEIRPNEVGTEGAEFDRYILFRVPGVQVKNEKVPASNAGNTEWLLRLLKSFNRGDASLVFADVYDDNAFLELNPSTMAFRPKHHRIKVYGAAGNFVAGPWLFKMELAGKTGVNFLNDKTFRQLGSQENLGRNLSEKNLIQAMIGLDYTEITDLSVNLELLCTKILDYQDNLFEDEYRFDSAVTINYDMLRETLHPQFFWQHFATNAGHVLRFSIGYDLRDALQLTAGLALYEGREGDFLFPYRRNDNIYASIKYSF